MTTPSAAPTTPAAPAPGNTIQDAIDTLFASKEADKPAPVKPAVVAPAEETPVAEGAQAVEPEAEALAAETEAPAVETAPAPEPKVSAADYAIQLAKARRKLAAATPPKPAEAAPSTTALELARAIEAAGSDPFARFEAAKLDLAAVVQAYDNRAASDPESADPLAKTVRTLGEKLAQFEAREQEAKDAASETQFLAVAEKAAKASDDFEYVVAHGAKGLELVKSLVLEAAVGNPREGIPPRVLPVGEALKMAEAYYSEEADIAAKTKKAAKKFATPQTPKKPGIPQQAPAAGAAPATQTKPKSVRDVIETSIDALLG